MVPVFPAAGTLSPIERAAAAVPDWRTVCIIFVIVSAVSGLRTSSAAVRVCSRIFPFLSSTRSTNTGVVRTPWSAKTPYADVSSRRFTSDVPRASDRSFPRWLWIPRRRAYDVTTGVPSFWRSFAAGTFRDLASAVRSVTGPRNLWS